jgi:hypothetical protein
MAVVPIRIRPELSGTDTDLIFSPIRALREPLLLLPNQRFQPTHTPSGVCTVEA